MIEINGTGIEEQSPDTLWPGVATWANVYNLDVQTWAEQQASLREAREQAEAAQNMLSSVLELLAEVRHQGEIAKLVSTIDATIEAHLAHKSATELHEKALVAERIKRQTEIEMRSGRWYAGGRNMI